MGNLSRILGVSGLEDLVIWVPNNVKICTWVVFSLSFLTFCSAAKKRFPVVLGNGILWRLISFNLCSFVSFSFSFGWRRMHMYCVEYFTRVI